MQRMKVALAGEGGQGVQLVGEVLALAGFLSGLHALYIPNFGVEQRGGVSLAYVQLAHHPIGSPKFRDADVLVALSTRAMERTRPLVGPRTLLIYDSSSIQPPVIDDEAIGIQSWDTVAPEAFAHMTGTKPNAPASEHDDGNDGAGCAAPFVAAVPAADVARREFIPRVFNVVVMGAVVETIKMVTMNKVKEALDLKLGHKFKDDPRLRDLNHRALERGAEIIRRQRAREAAGRPEAASARDPQVGAAVETEDGVRSGAGSEAGRPPEGSKWTQASGPDMSSASTAELFTAKAYRVPRGRWILFPELCKGCGLCIETCPEDVLHWSTDLGAYGTPTVQVDGTGCIACRTCADHCPDCAIDVDRETAGTGTRTQRTDRASRG